MKATVRRHVLGSGVTPEDMQIRLKKLGSAFQNIPRTRETLFDLLGISSMPEVPWDKLHASFEKRHPISHNLGVVDRKYRERAQSAEREGGEIRITAVDVCDTLDGVLAAISAVHIRLFRPATAES